MIETIRVRAIEKYTIEFYWCDRWISHNDWRYAETLRYADLLQKRGITCTVQRREWGHRGYYHLTCNDQQTKIMLQAQSEDLEAWKKKQEADYARYAASLAVHHATNFDEEVIEEREEII